MFREATRGLLRASHHSPTRRYIRRAFARRVWHYTAPHERFLNSSRFRAGLFIRQDNEGYARRRLVRPPVFKAMSESPLPAALLQATVAGMALGNPLADPAGAAKFALGAGPKAFWALAKKVPAIGKFFAEGVCSSGEWLGAAFARAIAAAAKDSEKGECLAAFKETHWWIKEFGEGEHGPVKQFYKTLLATKDAEVAGCFGAAWTEGELAEILAESTGVLATNHLERLRSTHLDGCPEDFQNWFIVWVRDELPGRFMDEVYNDTPTSARWHGLQLQSIAAHVGDLGGEVGVAQQLTRDLAQFTADQFAIAKQQSLSPDTVSQLNEFAKLMPGLIQDLSKVFIEVRKTNAPDAHQIAGLVQKLIAIDEERLQQTLAANRTACEEAKANIERAQSAGQLAATEQRDAEQAIAGWTEVLKSAVEKIEHAKQSTAAWNVESEKQEAVRSIIEPHVANTLSTYRSMKAMLETL